MNLLSPSSPISPFKLERFFARWEFTAPHLLCTSDIQGYRLDELLQLADNETLSLWNDLTLGYTESSGHPLLKEEIGCLYQGIRADNVLCFAGAEEAIYIAVRVLLRPGDHMIVSFPGYQSSYQIAETIGAEVSRWQLKVQPDENGQLSWQVNLGELRALLRPNTRLILVNFPHNPTGALPTRAEWDEIVAIAREANCYLFSDEVYRYLEYSPEDRLPAAADLYDKAISLGVMSKPFGLAGLRIGWSVTKDQELLAQLASYKDYTTICNSAPSEILAMIALRSKEKVLRRSLGIIRANLDLVEETMQDLQEFFEWIPPRAGSISFPRWRGAAPVEQFCEELVQTTGVLLLPGSLFDILGSHFRLGLGKLDLPAGLHVLRQYLKR